MSHDPRLIEKARRERPSLTPRERAVLILASAIAILVPWGWGGVVLWTVAAALGLTTAALLAAVGTLMVQRYALVLWFGGILVAFTQVPMDADPFTAHWLDYFAFPVAAFIGQAVPAFLLSGDNRSRPALNCFRDLMESIPFWAGIALFAYIAVQGLNSWGTVIERDLFWRITKENPLSWLPSGLRAPFLSDEDPGGMNAWRLMMIIAVPWMLFCALRAGLRRRRGYVQLAWIAIGATCVFAVFALLNQNDSNTTILGFKIPANCSPFGTFINRNHAGAYFYLNATLAMALVYWHIRRAGDVALRGGPHLMAAFLALFLALFATFTNSVGSMGMIMALALVVAPLAYFMGMPRESMAYKEVAFVTLGALLTVSFIFLFSANFKGMEKKFNTKVANYQAAGADDRSPLRHATWEMASAGGATGKIWTGWGAGSYRWVSPYFQAQQKEMQHTDGRLKVRATYAHFDWLQLLAEIGILGFIPIAVGLWWLGRWIRRAFYRGHPEAIPLACILILISMHACVELLFWFTPITCMIAIIAATLIAFVDQSSAENNGQKEGSESPQEIG